MVVCFSSFDFGERRKGLCGRSSLLIKMPPTLIEWERCSLPSSSTGPSFVFLFLFFDDEKGPDDPPPPPPLLLLLFPRSFIPFWMPIDSSVGGSEGMRGGAWTLRLPLLEARE